jgi:hypothetical protein
MTVTSVGVDKQGMAESLHHPLSRNGLYKQIESCTAKPSANWGKAETICKCLPPRKSICLRAIDVPEMRRKIGSCRLKRCSLR